MDLQDRSILLTGAGSGIGAALALELAARSARITLVGRRSEPLEEVGAMVRERGGQANVVPLDLTESGSPAAAIAAAQAHFGGVDVLINNAGNVRAGRLEALDESEVLAQVALNLTAPILLTRAAIPALSQSQPGGGTRVQAVQAFVVRAAGPRLGWGPVWLSCPGPSARANGR